MTTVVDIINRALQSIGTRTTVTQAELDANGSNEAIQAKLVYENIRDDLMRMAPWNCSVTAENLSLLSALPGTPENPGTYNGTWAPGMPLPPWLYEYTYPADCLRALYIVSQPTPTTGAVPIFPVATGYAPGFQGPPVKFKVATDRFSPVGAPVEQRVILTNQPSACLMYCRQVTDPNIMDTLFTSAWADLLGATLAMALTGDKNLAKLRIAAANQTIEQARAMDGNEGLTIIDSTPDWIQTRGWGTDNPMTGFNWGPLWPTV